MLAMTTTEDHFLRFNASSKPSGKAGFIEGRLKAHLPAEDDHETASFFVADLGEVYRQYVRWTKNLIRVKPFYGM